MTGRLDKSPRASVSICPVCGKHRYVTKADAKLMTRQLRRYGKKHAYKCGDYWHIGTMPQELKDGEVARGDMRPKRRPTP